MAVLVVVLLTVSGGLLGAARGIGAAGARLTDAVGPHVERRLGRAGRLGRRGLEEGADLALGRLRDPLTLVSVLLVAVAVLTAAVTWDGQTTLLGLALGVILFLAAARIVVRILARLTGGRRRPL